MENIKVSACIVTYNNSDNVFDTVDSLLSTTKDLDFTLYIVDNCSSDNTVNLLKEKYKDKIIILEQKENNGFGAGHNVVIPLLKSKYHFIVNPDIIVSETTIKDMVEFFEKNNDIVMACPKILNEDNSEQFLPKRVPKYKYLISRRIPFMKKTESYYSMRNYKFEDITDIEFCTGCFMTVRTDIFKKIKGFDDRYFMYFEDADLTREFSKYGRTVMYRGTSVVHRWERASSKSMKYLMIQIGSMNKYFKKWKKDKR